MRSFNHYLSLSFQKAKADLLSESRHGYMGILWWIIEPILYMAVFYIVFGVLFQRGGSNFVAFLLVGLVFWKWFASSISQSSNCIVSNIGLIFQVYIPKMVFPGIVLITNTFKFLIVLSLLILFLLITGERFTLAWTALPALLAIQACLILAIGSLLAAVVPFIPDLKLIIDNGLMLLFFMSGIFYDINSSPLKDKSFIYLNPIAGLIANYRKILLEGIWPDWLFLLKVLLFSIFGLLLGGWLLKRFDGVYPKII